MYAQRTVADKREQINVLFVKLFLQNPLQITNEWSYGMEIL